MFKFFLNSEGGALAFKKEEDTVKFPDTPMAVVSSNAIPPPPGVDGDSPPDVDRFLDVSSFRSALLCVSTSSPSTTYSLSYFMAKKTGVAKDVPFMFDFEFDLSGNIARGIDVSLFDKIYVMPVEVSGGSVTVEVGVALWDGERGSPPEVNITEVTIPGDNP